MCARGRLTGQCDRITSPATIPEGGRPRDVEQALLAFVVDSKGSPDPTVQRCAANSISLLNAMRVSFSGVPMCGGRCPARAYPKECRDGCHECIWGRIGCILTAFGEQFFDLVSSTLTGHRTAILGGEVTTPTPSGPPIHFWEDFTCSGFKSI